MTAAGNRRIALIAIAAGAFLVGAIIGAYLDWILWIAYQGLTITLAAGAILAVAGPGALVGRRFVGASRWSS